MLRYGLLFIPYVLAVLLWESPTVSYLVAWSGSLYILGLTLSSTVKPLPGGRSLARQLFRPIGLTQLMFAGYTALTSIFYFLDLQGYFYLSHDPFRAASAPKIALAAEAQRYYVLGHAAVSTGVLAAMDYRRSGEWQLRTSMSQPWFMLYLAGGLFLASLAFSWVPGLGQIQGRLSTLAFVASVLSLAVSIVQGRRTLMLANVGVYGVNFLQALLSGQKSEVIVAVLLLAIFLYPWYRRTMTVLAPAVLVVLFAVLPTYVGVIRSLNWRGNVEAEKAAQMAYERVLSDDAPMAEINWQFMTNRFSEIGMFTDYIDYVPDEHPHYGFTLAEHGAMGVIPRAVWPGKPNMERLAMERVYEAGVVKRGTPASAKPKFVVDAYLSGGALGVLLGGLLYGLLASWASRLAERWFGGYLLGSGLVYTALFKVFWLSNAFEFFFNTVFWSFLLMGALFVAGRTTGYLVREPQDQPVAA
ncbi:exosortase Y-associated Wzy-like protein [Salinibacter grassmerensis]|uniref:exosortase Y-associated Wzy-like protein n=1 Tax=Salinibacter grassmerensis TaxID=3040353 RepID=UPI0021E8FE8D|nr:hypothetical protein [Salinibacter grassmerensis]